MLINCIKYSIIQMNSEMHFAVLFTFKRFVLYVLHLSSYTQTEFWSFRYDTGHLHTQFQSILPRFPYSLFSFRMLFICIHIIDIWYLQLFHLHFTHYTNIYLKGKNYVSLEILAVISYVVNQSINFKQSMDI